MRRFSRQIALSIATVLCASPLAAQDTINVGSGDRDRRDIAPMRTKPIIIAKTRLNKVVQLNRVPDSALRIKQWPGVTIARAAPAPPGGISSAGATIYVSKSWIEQKKPEGSRQCYGPPGGSADWLDLSEPRRHGFRLSALDLQPLTSPGYASEGPNRSTNAYFDADQKPVGEIGQTVQLALVTPILARRIPQLPTILCFAGYRANISLYGPAGIDPFTGQTITPARVN